MIFKGIGASEDIWFQSPDTRMMYRFIMSKHFEEASNFSLSCSFDDEWFYSFCSDDASAYERVKFSVMSILCNCENEVDMLPTISKMIEELFSDILYVEAE